jgi:hypothetical protein
MQGEMTNHFFVKGGLKMDRSGGGTIDHFMGS